MGVDLAIKFTDADLGNWAYDEHTLSFDRDDLLKEIFWAKQKDLPADFSFNVQGERLKDDGYGWPPRYVTPEDCKEILKDRRITGWNRRALRLASTVEPGVKILVWWC